MGLTLGLLFIFNEFHYVHDHIHPPPLSSFTSHTGFCSQIVPILHSYERKCDIFLSESGLTWWFPFHPISCKWHFIILYVWIKLHCAYILRFLYPFICWWVSKLIP
jgi:hypothetical protein